MTADSRVHMIGFTSTYKITSTSQEGEENFYFVKTGTGKDAQVMFEGEPRLCSLALVSLDAF